MQNKVTASLSAESTLKITEAMNTIFNELPFLIQLTPTESRRIIRMEAGRIDFVRKALLLATTNEKLCPQFFEIGELDKDVSLCQSFDSIIATLEKLLKQLNDTRNQAGHEAYTAALEVYNTAKRATAKGIPGAQIAYEELKLMFNGNGKPGNTETDPVK
jgi:hypothetical protein